MRSAWPDREYASTRNSVMLHALVLNQKIRKGRKGINIIKEITTIKMLSRRKLVGMEHESFLAARPAEWANIRGVFFGDLVPRRGDFVGVSTVQIACN